MRGGGLLNRALLTLMAGHFTVDLYAGLLPVLYPLLRERYALDLRETGLIATIFTAAASLSQPLFGFVADRAGNRWLAPLAVGWMAAFFALLGFAPGYGTLVALVVLAGLGSGAYHPQGAANAAAAVPPARLNIAMSLYTVGGTSGFALGALVGALVASAFGLHGPLALLPFGAGVALWMAIQFAPRPAGDVRQRDPSSAVAGGASQGPVAVQWRPLLAILGIVMVRSWVFLTITSLAALLYSGLGYGPRFYSPLVFTLIIAGSLGTLCGGWLADRIGRRPVIAGSLALLGPAIWLFLALPGPAAFALGALVGFLADASLSPTLTLAQGLVPGRAGVTSGLILGLGFVTGGIGVSITGAVGDRIGLTAALALLPALLVVAFVLLLFVPRDDRHTGPAGATAPAGSFAPPPASGERPAVEVAQL